MLLRFDPGAYDDLVIEAARDRADEGPQRPSADQGRGQADAGDRRRGLQTNGPDQPDAWARGWPIRTANCTWAARICCGCRPRWSARWIRWSRWQAATRNIAEAYGKVDELGTVEVGKRADLLVLDGNPLDDVTAYGRIASIVKDGRIVDRDRLPERPILTAAAVA